ncbi:MAG: oligoribonuclease, partial [Daejeonella sp.]|nr:oligoribonuclease [Daejeonella sp.]
METKNDLIPATSWVLTKDHQDFLKSQTDDILSFGAKSALKQGGFGILNDVGKTVSAAVDTMQNARMTHCFSLASIMYPEYGLLADHGIKALLHLIQ